ncbi:MurR/RpiR family transcriptional regulator [Enterococcus pallens]|uniref:HTH rpiR-type domain-containing protein n=1 Tax=Enterococcus pallens ATCC BAA-351 TaxID=1158607 RepID=R2SXF6_9ENTE|nr:MurR/RpiR family transcriptional regulator [Enterococcus pallens]EOH97441.1 hypothetical protein UAU_00109 [Enterococcus pallens ATCC BAA-351]EOU21140.1 hypothetical protein I588_01987 [Enterococcus pallens ATCC BAA-351]OJG80656.1 hypothetical protein RV10_GL004393 [Enterococcus pallens]
MSNIRIQLLSILNREPADSVNFVITKYILENIKYQKKISMSDMANACNVSKASISRYSKRLGYEDYFDFQLALATYRVSKNDYFYLNAIESDDLFNNYFSKVKNQVDYLSDNLDLGEIEHLVELIKSHDNIFLMGQVSSGFAAVSLQDNLTKLGKVVRTSHDFVEQKELIETLEDDALVIVFSAGGKFFERVEPNPITMQRLKKPTIYFITIDETKDYSYVNQTIVLGQETDYSSWMLLNVYSDLLYLNYKRKFDDESVS